MILCGYSNFYLIHFKFLIYFSQQVLILQEDEKKKHNFFKATKGPPAFHLIPHKLNALKRRVTCLALTLAEYDINRLLTW